MPRKPKPPAQIASLRALAAALGKSHTAVGRWLKDDRWPFARKPPWNAPIVAQINSWASRTLSENRAAEPPAAAQSTAVDPVSSLTPERQAKLALSLERLETQKLTNELRRGNLHSFDDCRNRRIRQVTELRDALLSIPDALPLRSDQKEMIRGRIIETLTRFANQDPAPPSPTLKIGMKSKTV
jgi:hypothetical protein